jgi:putative hydrolase of the HAD superfamily
MVVFLDVAGTLLRVRGGVGQQYAAVARRFGVDPDPAALDREFPAAFRAAPPMAFPGVSPHAIPERERAVWREIVRTVFEGAGLLPAFAPAAFDAYFDAVYAHFEEAGVWEVFPDVPPALAALRDLGCPLGIISNFDGRLFRILDRLGLRAWFASVTLSSQVGAAKPACEIFAHALRRHGVEAGDALHVGDSPVADCEGARAAGLRAVLIDRAGRHADRPGVLRAASLAAVVDVIRNTA